MKKKGFIFLLLGLAYITCLGQGINVAARPEAPKYIRVGTLQSDKNSGGNIERVKIELFGGHYNEGPQTRVVYVVDTRYECRISKEVVAGITNSHNLKIYQRGNLYDVVIEVVGWGVYNIRSYTLDNTTYPIDYKCTAYDISDKIDVTSKFTTTLLTTSDKNGNVGIGTEKPLAKLDVRGKIISEEVEIKIISGADFVFSPNYNLKPLSEVEIFIKENQHLPEIPSEKEMQADGLNLNNMQIKLLQKIEELTLYVIEQDKRIKELEAK